MTYQSLNYYRQSDQRSGAADNDDGVERVLLYRGGEPAEDTAEPEPGGGLLPGERVEGVGRELQQVAAKGPEGVCDWPCEREYVPGE